MLFLLHVSRSEYPANLVSALCYYYPQAPKVCIADGEVDPQWWATCASHGIDFHQSNRLKLWPNGGTWTARWMNTALSYSEKFGEALIIKLDADCMIYRPFEPPPEAPIAGHVTCPLHSHLAYCRGGVVAYQRSAIEQILKSGLLADRCYQNPVLYAYENQGEILSSEDQIIGHIAKRLGIAVAFWPEVYNAWREPVPSGNYAVIAGATPPWQPST